ncbi:hypothetical protein BGZ58_005022, partial [Dissophora ornata]
MRALAEQAENPHADVQQIMHHLHANMEAMSHLQHQVTYLQTVVQEQAQSSPAPITSLSAAPESLAAHQLEQQQMQQNYQANLQHVLDRLSQRSAVGNSRSPIRLPLSPKFKGPEGDMTFAEFKSKLTTSFARFRDSLHTNQERVNYALQSMEGTPSQFFASYINGDAEDVDGFLTSWESFSRALQEPYGDQHYVEENNH